MRPRAVRGPRGRLPGLAGRQPYALTLVDPGRRDDALVWSRPWHEVDAGSWSRESSHADRDLGRPLPAGAVAPRRRRAERIFLQTLRERVQASVVLAEELACPAGARGAPSSGRTCARASCVEQVVLGRGVQADEEVSAAVGPRPSTGCASRSGCRAPEPAAPRGTDLAARGCTDRRNAYGYLRRVAPTVVGPRIGRQRACPRRPIPGGHRLCYCFPARARSPL